MARNSDYGGGGRSFFKYSEAKLSFMGGYLLNRKGIPTASWGSTFNDSSTHTVDERFFADLTYRAIESPSGTLKLRSYLNGYNYDGSYAYAPDPVCHDHSRSFLTLSGKNILINGLDASLSICNLFDRHYGQPGAGEHLPVALIPQDGIAGALKLSYRF